MIYKYHQLVTSNQRKQQWRCEMREATGAESWCAPSSVIRSRRRLRSPLVVACFLLLVFTKNELGCFLPLFMFLIPNKWGSSSYCFSVVASDYAIIYHQANSTCCVLYDAPECAPPTSYQLILQ